MIVDRLRLRIHPSPKEQRARLLQKKNHHHDSDENNNKSVKVFNFMATKGFIRSRSSSYNRNDNWVDDTSTSPTVESCGTSDYDDASSILNSHRGDVIITTMSDNGDEIVWVPSFPAVDDINYPSVIEDDSRTSTDKSPLLNDVAKDANAIVTDADHHDLNDPGWTSFPTFTSDQHVTDHDFGSLSSVDAYFSVECDEDSMLNNSKVWVRSASPFLQAMSPLSSPAVSDKKGHFNNDCAVTCQHNDSTPASTVEASPLSLCENCSSEYCTCDDIQSVSNLDKVDRDWPSARLSPVCDESFRICSTFRQDTSSFQCVNSDAVVWDDSISFPADVHTPISTERGTYLNNTFEPFETGFEIWSPSKFSTPEENQYLDAANVASSHEIRNDDDTLSCPLTKEFQLQNNAVRLYEIGNDFINFKQYSNAIEIYQESLGVLQCIETLSDDDTCNKNSVNIFEIKTNVMYSLGEAYRHSKDYTQAVHVYEKVIVLIKTSPSSQHSQYLNNTNTSAPSLAQIYTSMALAHIYLQKYHLAIQNLNMSLTLHRRQRKNSSATSTTAISNKTIAALLNNLGNCHYAQGQYTTALKYYKDSLKIYLSFNHGDVITHCATIFNNVGSSRRHLGELEKCKGMHQKALQLLQKWGMTESVCFARTCEYLGGVCLSLGEEEEAVRVWRSALELYEWGEVWNGVVRVLDELGRFLERKGGGCAVQDCQILRIYERMLQVLNLAQFDDGHGELDLIKERAECRVQEINKAKLGDVENFIEKYMKNRQVITFVEGDDTLFDDPWG